MRTCSANRFPLAVYASSVSPLATPRPNLRAHGHKPLPWMSYSAFSSSKRKYPNTCPDLTLRHRCSVSHTVPRRAEMGRKCCGAHPAQGAARVRYQSKLPPSENHSIVTMHVHSVHLGREDGLAAETMMIIHLDEPHVRVRLPFPPTGFAK
jgi:hypothetical protein